MKLANALATLAVSTLALGAVAIQPVASQPAPRAGIVGQAKSAKPGCPYLIWRLAQHPGGDITGIFYYSDLSGTSEAKGHIDPDGKFRITLTSAMGNGPVGVVEGQRAKNGTVKASLKGEGCANNTYVDMRTITDLNTYGSVAGG